MSRHLLGWCLVGLLAACANAQGGAVDACPSHVSLSEPLGLSTAVAMALCADPQVREAWLSQLSSQANLDAAHSAYWPTVQAQLSSGRANRKTRYDNFPEADSTLSTRTNSYGLDLSWVLYDFGLRAAKVEGARQVLNAASSSRVEKIQATVLDTSKAFYQVQANAALLEAKRSAESLAANSLKAATAKYQAGAGEQSDRLQAQTTHEQAQLERVLAEGEYAAAQGALASALGLSPSAPLTLAALNEPAGQEAEFTASVDALMAQARAQHPAIDKARAEWAATRAKADEARAEGRPKVSLFSSYQQQDTPIDQVSTRQQIETWSVGVQISVPIFDGFLSRRRARAADYEAGAREQAVAQTERTVALNVWKSRQALDARTRALSISRSFVSSAGQSHRVALGRYKAGVGSIIELLRAQNELAIAEQRRVEAQVNWYTARLQLAADLGQLHGAL
ncbi:TolC family protein [Pseudomonas rubra]|uniref:Protein CyaE n=1 Tax=Pseudomonas rubra TaxID=2942627 RepID=A0ABT5PB81_9PSED|nr:TolC family protein [Pseudomonas rubra]MDD1015475.1 TolC family protein [Pseudomonas rubra]MDD1041289.1 TolC family protein [Pseudomonas rubra]MDD1157126.1 TolC family protein [Pseudomonas rubra]